MAAGGWWASRPVDPLPSPSRGGAAIPGSRTPSRPPPVPPPVPRTEPGETPSAPDTPPQQKDWKTLLCSLAGEGYEDRHPGTLARLAALLESEARDDETLPGVLAYLARGLGEDEIKTFWKRAFLAVPGDPLVADMMLRAHLQRAEDPGELEEVLDLVGDPHALFVKASLAAEAGSPEGAQTLLDAAGRLAWEDLSGRTEHGLVQVLDALGESPGVFERFEILVRYPRPEAAFYGRIAEACQGGDGRLLEGVSALAGRIEQWSRSLVGWVSATHLGEEALAALADHALATGDVPLQERARKERAELEERRKAFWAWNKEYRRQAAEPLRPVFARLGIPFSEASALHGLESLKGREAELLPDERKLLEGAVEAVYAEMDAFRASSRGAP